MDSILRYTVYKNWYININKSLKAKYKKDYMLFAGLLSATSPRFQIKRNWNTSQRIYNDYLKEGQGLIDTLKANEAKTLKRYKLLKAHYNNIIRVLENGNREGLKLGGNKVNAFYNNLIGNYGYITIDVWMLKIFKFKRRYTPNKTEYKTYSNMVKSVRRKLKKAYGFRLHNSQVQAILWEWQRAKEGLQPSNFNKHIKDVEPIKPVVERKAKHGASISNNEL